jgi:multidrug resistance efflux pump
MASWLTLTDRLSKEVNHLRGVAEKYKVLEEDLEGLLMQRQADRAELDRLRAQTGETAELLEENVVLRQHMMTMQRDMRTLTTALAAKGNSEAEDNEAENTEAEFRAGE